MAESPQYMKNFVVCGIAFGLFCIGSTASFGQGTGGAPGGGGTPVNTSGQTAGQTATQTPTANNTTGGQQTGGHQTGNIGTQPDGNVDPVDAVKLETSEDTRNQGFIGSTATRVTELGFVGASSETSGPPLAAGATFGGGVNTGGAAGGAGGGRAAGGGGQIGQGFGGAGTQNGFSVTRQSLRARLVPSFSAPVVSSAVVADRFKASFARLPESLNMSGQYQVSVNNRTATITGFVPTRADSDRLVRQLRLQPGIYKIDNQLQVAQ